MNEQIVANFAVQTPMGKFYGSITFKDDEECCKALVQYRSGKIGLMMEGKNDNDIIIIPRHILMSSVMEITLLGKI